MKLTPKVAHVQAKAGVASSGWMSTRHVRERQPPPGKLFTFLTAACAAHATWQAALHVQADVQADREGRAVRVGKASLGLVARYRGGTGHALDAAMHDSGNSGVRRGRGCRRRARPSRARRLIYDHREGAGGIPTCRSWPHPERIDSLHDGGAPRFEPGTDDWRTGSGSSFWSPRRNGHRMRTSPLHLPAPCSSARSRHKATRPPRRGALTYAGIVQTSPRCFAENHKTSPQFAHMAWTGVG